MAGRPMRDVYVNGWPVNALTAGFKLGQFRTRINTYIGSGCVEGYLLCKGLVLMPRSLNYKQQTCFISR
jgi:hypothetical protein